MAAKWHIAVDTGGTFTDCIAVSPEGKIHRVKVLSSSRLRGVLGEKIAPRQFRFLHNWRGDEDIFKGYRFALITDLSNFENLTNQSPHDAGCFIETIDFQKNILTLSDDLPNPQSPLTSHQSPVFEITAHEEAPILAARLVTGTPLAEPLPPMEMRLGTTKGTNALLEKKGAATALLITQGFGDLLAIGTQQRPHLFQLNIPEPELLYTHAIEVRERLDAQGNILKPLTDSELRRVVSKVKKCGVQSVAVALLHAWRNPVHELKMREALEAAGIRFVSLSHELMPAIKILPRAQTALVDAYLSPVLNEYLNNISQTLYPTNPQTPKHSKSCPAPEASWTPAIFHRRTAC